MSASLELPDELVRDVRLRAAQQGQDLNDAVAQLVRRGLAVAAVESGQELKADAAQLARRKEIADKFISGEWGVELEGFEAGRAGER
jgi:plasmid stability protein